MKNSVSIWRQNEPKGMVSLLDRPFSTTNLDPSDYIGWAPAWGNTSTIDLETDHFYTTGKTVAQ